MKKINQLSSDQFGDTIIIVAAIGLLAGAIIASSAGMSLKYTILALNKILLHNARTFTLTVIVVVVVIAGLFFLYKFAVNDTIEKKITEEKMRIEADLENQMLEYKLQLEQSYREKYQQQLKILESEKQQFESNKRQLEQIKAELTKEAGNAKDNVDFTIEALKHRSQSIQKSADIKANLIAAEKLNKLITKLEQITWSK